MDVSGKNKLMSQHMEIKVRKWTLERGSKVTIYYFAVQQKIWDKWILPAASDIPGEQEEDWAP